MPHPLPPGDDTAVLLLHGLYSNPNEMSPLGKELEKAGYRVAIPHLQGYTVCAEDVLDRRFARSPWEDWYAQVETVFDELRQQHRRVVVGGLCIGADLALHLAAQRGLQVAAVLALAGCAQPAPERASVAAPPPSQVVRHPVANFPISSAVEVPAGASTVYLSGTVPPQRADGSYGNMQEQTTGVLQSISAQLAQLASPAAQAPLR